ncbi:hypothetical protein FPOA_03694 [Fusarium poae]|uniref:Heterokaryon incompatibility domain-containing protein n=1 Tax=Fusarium poae TaxID=36050 RepID=A0A1B8ARX1_FUSPO|nr:hypothetical protein FPOA_03694 [Fusarium poae]
MNLTANLESSEGSCGSESQVESVDTLDIYASCDRCRNLRLNKDKFTISETPKASDTSVVSKYDPVGLGSLDFCFLDEIYANRITCSLCRLIYNTTHSENNYGLGHDGLDEWGKRISCSMEWHLDSRSSGSVASTRRLRIFNKKDQFREFYIVPILASGSDQNSNQARRRSGTEFDFDLAELWFYTCLDCHTTCGDEKNSNEPRFVPKRLLDVHSLCLCVFDEGETRVDLSYAALSYCWGLSLPLRTTKLNFDQHCRGIAEDDLPKTIRDASTIARELGIGYIWVDALCIIQDCREDWEEQAGQMHRIYAEAALTICAAAGDDCNHGIPGIQDTPMKQFKDVEIHEGLPLTTLTPVSKIISSTGWDSRAWTLQERLLSRRCLISSPDGMIWQCKCTTWRDDVDSCMDNDTWNLDLVGSPLAALQGNPLRSYTSCAEIYSGRNMAFLGDKVMAFEGISGALEGRLGTSFKYSMPLRYLDWVILWAERESGEGFAFNPRSDKPKRTEFPSWSWCGWHLPIHWPRSSLEGTLFNLRDWFANRTWIVWYIGRSGQWSLAWDGGNHTSPKVHLNRWDGYITGQHDPYGRLAGAAGCRFRSQVTADEATEPTSYRFHPSLEGNLLFQTFTGHFSLSRKTMTGPVANNNEKMRLHQFGITDSFGDWCGTITLDKSWYNQVGAIFEFVAISEAKDFSMEELDTWTYYVSEERQQAEWYCFYALMIRWKETDAGPVAERVGLAKIFQSSFFYRSLKPCIWKTIVLG